MTMLCKGVLMMLLAAMFTVLPAQEDSYAAPVASPAPKAAICLVIDDFRNMDVWMQLSRDADKYGFKTAFAIDTARVKPEDWSLLAERVAAGHEVASHTRNHVPLAVADAVRVRYWAPGVSSARATVADGHLRFYADGSTEPLLDIDLSMDGSTPTLRDVVDAISRVRGFSAELVNPYYTSVRATFLLPVKDVDIFFRNGHVPLFLDQAQHATYELTESKKDIERNLPGYACRSIVYPFLVNGKMTRRIAGEAGFTTGRTGTGGVLLSPGNPSVDVFRLWAEKPKTLFGVSPSAAEFERKVTAFLDGLKKTGGVACIYSHGEEEYSNEEWRMLLALLAVDSEIKVTTLDGLREFAEQTGKASAAMPAKVDVAGK